MTGLIHEPLIVEAPVETELVRDLRDAKRIVERGWGQGHAIDRGDRHCMVGAVMSTSVSYVHKERMIRALKNALGESVNVFGIIDWNDAPGRTQEEVLAVFDRAILNATGGDET